MAFNEEFQVSHRNTRHPYDSSGFVQDSVRVWNPAPLLPCAGEDQNGCN